MNTRALVVAIALLTVACSSDPSSGAPDDDVPGTNDSSLPMAAAVVTTEIGQPPGGLETTCEYGHAWRLHSQHGQNVSVVPQRRYVTSCVDASGPRIFVSLPVNDGEGRTQYVFEATLDDAGSYTLSGNALHMAECEDASGIAAAPDCSQLGVLCHRAYGSSSNEAPDADLITPYADGAQGERGWVLRSDNQANEDTNTEMWLYEYDGANLSATPAKFLVHKAIRATNTARPQGQFYLVRSSAGDEYAMGVRSSMFTEGGARHVADAFLVIQRGSTPDDWQIDPSRGYPWACGRGHTTANHPGYNAYSDQFAIACRTDIGANAYFRNDTAGDGEPFHQHSFNGQGGNVIGGGPTTFVGLPDGGFLLALIGNPMDEVNQDAWTEGPPTRVGLARFDSNGAPVGDIDWVVASSEHFLGHAQIAEIEEGRYLLGWSEQWQIGDGLDDTNMWTIRRRHSFQSAWAYYVTEIDGDGNALTQPRRIEGAGWGDFDEWTSFGDGRIGWSYIADPELTAWDQAPACNGNARPALFVYDGR
ncbi:MAG: hypothetical protein AAGF92_06555 [Myxococcota bacterium]